MASLNGPTVFTQTFAVFIGAHADLNLPGAHLLLAAVLVFGSMLLAWRTTRPPATAAVSEPAAPF